jgi:hypothetical protein
LYLGVKTPLINDRSHGRALVNEVLIFGHDWLVRDAAAPT